MYPANLFFFIVCAVIAGTIFFVAALELLFTVRRRRLEDSLRKQLQELKAHYNESVNHLALEEDAKLEESSKQVETLTAQANQERATLEEEFKKKLEEAEHSNSTALAKAKARAKKLEEEAHQKAEEYLATRQQEVESELMDLVMHVTQKVLPESLSYHAQKELVLAALRDIQTSHTPKS